MNPYLDAEPVKTYQEPMSLFLSCLTVTKTLKRWLKINKLTLFSSLRRDLYKLHACLLVVSSLKDQRSCGLTLKKHGVLQGDVRNTGNN